MALTRIKLKICPIQGKVMYHCLGKLLTPTTCGIKSLNLVKIKIEHRQLIRGFFQMNFVRQAMTSVKTPWCGQGPFQNPLEFLQPFVDIPLLPETDKLFNPSLEKLKSMHRFFHYKTGEKVEVVRKVMDPDATEILNVPEVAFVGRSNVGKSSLIKALFFDPPGKDVKIPVSKVPGKTRSLNFYKVGRCFSLVDIPGYGHNMPKHYVESVEQYLQTRKKLSRIFLLVDGKVGLTETDRTGLGMLEEIGRPYVIVMTKIDKTSQHRLIKNVWDLRQEMDKLHGCLPQPFLVSSHYDAGLYHLRAFITYVTGNLSLS